LIKDTSEDSDLRRVALTQIIGPIVTPFVPDSINHLVRDIEFGAAPTPVLLVGRSDNPLSGRRDFLLDLSSVDNFVNYWLCVAARISSVQVRLTPVDYKEWRRRKDFYNLSEFHPSLAAVDFAPDSEAL
jgi:hypothetical protein